MYVFICFLQYFSAKIRPDKVFVLNFLEQAATRPMEAEMGHRQNTFNTFSLLTKLKRHIA